MTCVKGKPNHDSKKARTHFHSQLVKYSSLVSGPKRLNYDTVLTPLASILHIHGSTIKLEIINKQQLLRL